MMLRISACISTLLLAASAAAQDFPNKQISLAVPFAAGGPTDTLARNLGVAMTQQLKPHCQGQARRLQPADRSHWHGDRAGAVSQAAVQSAH
jgi:hypothetical protein